MIRRFLDLLEDIAWHSKSEPVHGDAGATLVLALLFMTASSLVVLGLLSWSQNNLTNVAAFQQSRTLNYAANSAMETAIGSVRYNPTACPSSGLTIPVPNPNSTYDMTMDVWCQQQSPGEQPSAASRVVTFTECWDTAFRAGTCSSGFTSGSPQPFLTATVTYDDYSDTIVGGQQIAYPTGVLCSVSTSCGAAMTITTWVFK
jgi:hypothetical protein